MAVTELYSEKMNVSLKVFLSLTLFLCSRCWQIGGGQIGVIRRRVEDEAGQLLFLTPELQDQAKAGPRLSCPRLASFLHTEDLSSQL